MPRQVKSNWSRRTPPSRAFGKEAEENRGRGDGPHAAGVDGKAEKQAEPIRQRVQAAITKAEGLVERGDASGLKSALSYLTEELVNLAHYPRTKAARTTGTQSLELAQRVFRSGLERIKSRQAQEGHHFLMLSLELYEALDHSGLKSLPEERPTEDFWSFCLRQVRLVCLTVGAPEAGDTLSTECIRVFDLLIKHHPAGQDQLAKAKQAWLRKWSGDR